MNKLRFVLLICCFATIFAELPDWYPKNELEIEETCRQDASITPETMKKIMAYEVDDTPEIRAFLLCLAHNKNVFRSEMGFKADRLQFVMQKRSKLDCKLDFIEGCGNKSKDVEPDDAMIFAIMQCILDGREENCKKIE
ncbi:uncharacterized protein [Musca autumnalis]|uniref:uncharacterized protein n=1 Tax=Musca autumnalis TaxID=221902 RepID=UPI003CFB69B5